MTVSLRPLGQEGWAVRIVLCCNESQNPHHFFPSLLRTLQATVNKTRAAYQNAAVAGKKLVEDADKLDIVVKACQTEYIKLKLLNNNAKAYVNAKRLKWQRQADSFRYWAEYVHFETIGAIQVPFEPTCCTTEPSPTIRKFLVYC